MLYESRRDDRILLIEPDSGHWWIGPAGRSREGRDEVRSLAREQPAAADIDWPALIVAIKNRDCNIACSYCFADAGPQHGYLSRDDLGLIFERVLASFPEKQVNFLFTGGEPFLHFPVISAAIEDFSKRAGQEHHEFSFMTNGTAFKAHMLPFLQRHRVGIGISLDGPAEIHDRNRPYGDGRGTHAAIMQGMDMLREAGISFGTVTTLVEPRDVAICFDYFREQGVHKLFFRPLRTQGRALSDPAAARQPDDEMQMATAMLELADRIASHNREAEHPVVELTLGFHMLHLLLRANPYMCMRSPCGAASMTKLGVDRHGGFFPCDTMVEFPELRMFDLETAQRNPDLKGLIRNAASHKTLCGRIVTNIPQCRECQVRRFCGGGCSAASYDLHGNLHSAGDRCHYERALFEGLLWRTAEQPDFPDLLMRGMEIPA